MISSLDDFDLAGFLPVASTFGTERYGFVVTPNVDHLIRLYDDPAFRSHYEAASFVLMDSRFAAHTIRLVKGVKLPVCPGSDLTAALLGTAIAPDDSVVLIGASAEQVALLRSRYGLCGLRHHNPPMGFINDASAVEACLDFVEKCSPFRFCFLAVGSPQQEALAHALLTRGIARGLTLCVGASLDFLTGAERRAPRWMQWAGIEWQYRLWQNPRRLARRYLVRGPRFFLQLPHCSFIVRQRAGDNRVPSNK